MINNKMIISRYWLLVFALLLLLIYSACSDRNYKNIFDPEATASNEWMPKNVQIQQSSLDELQLSWRKVHPDITGFVIDRRFNDEEWENDVAQLSADELAWSDTSFIFNTSCYYRIYAIAEDNLSAPAFISINPVVPAPGDISLTQINDQTVNVAWTDCGNGRTIFIIDRKIDDADWQVAIDSVNTGVSEWTDSSLVVGQSVHYKVSARYRNFSSLGIRDSLTLSFPAPEDFNLTVIDSTHIKLQWQPHLFDNINSYTIERKTDSGDFTAIATVTATDTEYIDESIENTHSYSYRMFAATSRNQSGYTAGKKIEWKGPFTYQWSGFHESQINSIAISPDGLTVASVGGDKVVKVWNSEDGSLAWTGTHSSYVLSVEFNADGTRILSYDNYDFKVWNANNGVVHFSGNHSGTLNDVHFSQDGQYIVSGGGTTVSLWDGSTGSNLWTVEHDPDASSESYKTVTAVAISSDNLKVAAGGEWNSKIDLLQTSDGSTIWSTSGNSYCLKFSPDNQQLIFGGQNIAGILDVNNYGHDIWTAGLRGDISSVHLNPDGSQLMVAASGQSKGIKVWNYTDGSLIWEEPESQSGAYNSTGEMIAYGTGSWDGISINVVKSTDKSSIWTGNFELPDGAPNYYVYAIEFSRDGKYLAAGGGSGELIFLKYGYDWEVSDD